MSDTNDMSLTPSDASQFAVTHWSVVVVAGSPESTHYQKDDKHPVRRTKRDPFTGERPLYEHEISKPMTDE